MLLDEGRLAARIHPPQRGHHPRRGRQRRAELFIVMEYVHGEPVSALIRAALRRGERIPPRVAAAMLAGALRGLHAAHEAKDPRGEPLGVVHRDVSPQNILVRERRRGPRARLRHRQGRRPAPGHPGRAHQGKIRLHAPGAAPRRGARPARRRRRRRRGALGGAGGRAPLRRPRRLARLRPAPSGRGRAAQHARARPLPRPRRGGDARPLPRGGGPVPHRPGHGRGAGGLRAGRAARRGRRLGHERRRRPPRRAGRAHRRRGGAPRHRHPRLAPPPRRQRHPRHAPPRPRMGTPPGVPTAFDPARRGRDRAVPDGGDP